ncbi:MAG: glycine cleavage system protein GcvH [Chloroflexi bacterium]|nr:glycine cleavage system protein GcvH [Chloroflexota bacterium]MBI3734714.1 glycine cleavage system protein GcvH [Chloroflexota bacterium]
MPSPADLRYSRDHEWVKLNGHEATIGITDYAQHALGDVVYVEVNAVGKPVVQFEVFGVVESVKAASDLFAPISGKVTAVNEALADNPEWVNAAPYGEGWMIKVSAANLAELDKLMSAADYDAYLTTL